MARQAQVTRNTNETQISVSLNLDGSGKSKLATGVGFLDHMLDQIARHGVFDLEITAKGDLHIDAHHTVEDVGITLGQAFAKAIGDKAGVRRYGHAYVPLDELETTIVDTLRWLKDHKVDVVLVGLQYVDRMARALATVINLVDPHVIVLGGGMSNIQRLYDEVPRRWGRYVFSDRVDTRLVPPRHGDSSGVRGAAWL